MEEPQSQILEPEEGAAGACTGAGDDPIIKVPSFDSSWPWCLLCVQQFDSDSNTSENDEYLQLHTKTLSHFTTLRKVPKKILLSALPNGKYCSNCTQSLNQIHHVQESIFKLQLELGELEAKLDGYIIERYNNLKELPTIDEEVKEVIEFRKYLYQASASDSKSKSVQKNARVSRRVHKSSLCYLDIKIEDPDQAEEGENMTALDAEEEVDTDPRPNPPSPELENESEQNHTRLRSGSKIRKRNLKVVEVHNQGRDTGESPFTCNECGSKFKAKWYFQQHLKIHDGPTPNLCEECGKGFSSKQALKLHITSHTQDRPFVCKICCASYKSNQYLLNHQANQHAGLLTNRPPIQCPTCSKLYSSASALRCHRLSAHGEGTTQFTCEICKSNYNSKREHDRHYNVVHLNIKTIECPECPKKFSYKSNLRMHVQRHHSTKEERPRPFQCEACGKAFHLKATLENHIKIHSGQTPFPCTQCDKRFPSKSYLDLHIYTIHENRRRKTQVPEGHQRN